MEGGVRILIADDEIDITELISSFLKAHGYECDVVNNGKDALIKAKENKYDLIILDVMMPYIDGYHVSYEITNTFDNPPPIIILTSRDTQSEKPIAKMSGAIEILQKPFELDKLLETIEKVIKGGSNV